MTDFEAARELVRQHNANRMRRMLHARLFWFDQHQGIHGRPKGWSEGSWSCVANGPDCDCILVPAFSRGLAMMAGSLREPR